MAIYEGSVGFRFNFTVDVDISSPAVFQVDMVRPDGSLATWTPTVDSGPAGTCHHDTLATDLTMAGTYHMRPRFFPTGSGTLRLGPAVEVEVTSVG